MRSAWTACTSCWFLLGFAGIVQQNFRGDACQISIPMSCCAGLQVSSVELERACLEGVPRITEAAAVGVRAPRGGPEQLVLFLVAKAGACRDGPAAKAQCQKAIRSKLNPLFKVERVSGSSMNVSEHSWRESCLDWFLRGFVGIE
jgi:acyl-CoA synthetase (AMP-forming)/AMP-acid ligase II